MNRLTNVIGAATPPAIDTSGVQSVILSAIKDGADAMNNLLVDALPIVMTVIIAMTVVMFGIKFFSKASKKA